MSDALELLEWLDRAGVRVTTAGDKLCLEPAERVPPDLVDALRECKAEILAHVRRREAVIHAHLKRYLWAHACFEMAEALGWPRLQIVSHMTVLAGEVPWRKYLMTASMPELRDRTLPALRHAMAGIGLPPSVDGSSNGHRD